jgi:hypothetical protein
MGYWNSLTNGMKGSKMIHELRHFIFISIGLMALSSCGTVELSPSEYVKWVEDEANGLLQKRALADIDFQLQYKPLDYLLEQENVSPELQAKRKEELRGMHYFNLTYLPKEKGKGDLLKQAVSSQSEYQQVLYYFSYQFNQQIFMLQGNDTLTCSLFHFVRDHGLSPTLRFVIGFENRGIEEDMQLVIHDEVFHNGPVKFNIKKQQLHSIPNIKRNRL